MTENVSPTTTAEQNLRTASQRKINFVWEYTQAAIALLIVVANVVYVFVILFVPNPPMAAILTNAFFLVVGFYFGRTNHARLWEDTTRRDP